MCPFLATLTVGKSKNSEGRFGRFSWFFVIFASKSSRYTHRLVFFPVQHVSWSFYHHRVEPQDFLFQLLSRQRSYGHPGQPVVPELSRSSKNRDFRCDQDFRRAKQQLTVSVDAPRARKSQNVRTGQTSCATTIAGGQSDTFRSQFEPPRTKMRNPNPQIRDTAFSGLLETFVSTSRPGWPYERCRDKP